MRVALLSKNAQFHNAVGNHVAEKVRFFQERGAEVRLFVEDARRLHPDVRWCARELREPCVDGPAWDYLTQADLLFAVYGQYYDLLQYLPRLAGSGPRIIFDYLGVTPPQFWNDQHREGLEKASQMRGYVWCADHALTISDANRRELTGATGFPSEHTTTLPLAIDVRHFHAAEDTRFLQKRLGIDGRILLYVGRFAGNKRVPLLIEALSRIDDPTLHAVLVGDCRDVYAAEVARCMSLVREHGLERRVHVVGELSESELALAYRSADVFVMPSVHEGFCVPIIEAMASCCPVIASRSEALPETVGDAGLTFAPGDVDDLVRQIQRVIRHRNASTAAGSVRRVAVVSSRFGADIAGGAETSLRTMARSLKDAGHHVEVFTTCVTEEGDWRNHVAAGSVTLDGLTVHRFPIDAADNAARSLLEGAIVAADGKVAKETEERYLAASIHSSALLRELAARRKEFDAIITGPYLFGLTADIARLYPDQTLIVSCFHDESLARMNVWPNLCRDVGGILYHSKEEQQLAQARLGVNHPNAAVIGTCLPGKDSSTSPFQLGRPYVVYCGRYSEAKNVCLLINWARRFQERHPSRLDFVFMGKGDIALPKETWLHDLGFVSEEVKRSVIGSAVALVQLSHNESLSLVALEAWAERVPVIVHRDCDVLVGQIERSDGGAVVADFAGFEAVVNDWLSHDAKRRAYGSKGHDYLDKQYRSQESYVASIVGCIDRLQTPINEQMRAKGIERARKFSRDAWQARFGEFVERVLTQPARSGTSDLCVEPLRSSVRAARTPSLLLAVRLINRGTRAAAAEGPGRTVLCIEIRSALSDAVVVPCVELPLQTLVMPSQSQVAVLPIEIPLEEGAYCIRLWAEGPDRSGSLDATAEIALTVAEDDAGAESCMSVYLDAIARTLPRTHQLQQLPSEYVDVTEGAFAPLKRFLKGKMLHNFKHAYVDVLSRQQSQMNGNVVAMIQQLAECCTVLDQRLAAVERSSAANVPDQNDITEANAGSIHG